MIKKILIIFLILLSTSTVLLYAEQAASSSDSVKVATIGERIIYHADIKWKGKISDEVDYFEEEKIRLKQVVRKEILRTKIVEYGIKPTLAEIDEQATLIIKKDWESYGETEEARQNNFNVKKNMLRKLHAGLEIWKKDKRQGDLFAKQELEPLGINASYWDWVTKKKQRS